MHPSTLAKRGTVLLFLALIAFYFYGLGHFPLLGPDEPRYAQVAREMFLRGDLITPTLGGHLWFEKPALLYWMMILSFKLFGVSEFSARLGPALSGLLTIAAVWWIGKRVESVGSNEEPSVAGELGFWSALAAGTTAGMVAFSRAASFDIVVTMTMTWALAFFIVSELEKTPRRRRRYLIGFYTFIGLSLLAKGLIGIVIPFGVVSAYYVFRRRLPERNASLSLFWGIPLALVVAATWYAPVIWRHGWPFVDQFFIQQQFARYVSDKYHHPAPVYFYLLILIPVSLPWAAFLIDGIAKARVWRRRVNDPGETALDKLLIFASAWFLTPLLFFSFSSSKLPGYILPVLPAAALIVGERLWRLSSDATTERWPIRITGVFCVVLAMVAVAYHWRTGNLTAMFVYLLTIPLIVGGGFVMLARSRTRAAILAIAGTTVAVMIVLLLCLAPAVAELKSSKRLLELADSRGYSQAAIYGMQRTDRTPEFYAAGRVVYDSEGEPIMYEGAGQIVWETRRRQAAILAMVPVAEVSQFTQLSSVRVEVIGDNERYALIAVAPP